MQVAQIGPGLWRWTARHPAWAPTDAGPDGWEAEVGCVYWETPEAVVLVDPLVPAEPPDRERFWRALDLDVDRIGAPVIIVLTCAWHARSSNEIIHRYEAQLHDRQEPLPGKAAAYPAAEETVLWLAEPRALIVGDVLLGDGADGVELCPASWLPPEATLSDIATSLRPLLDLPVERILVSHGEPVLEGGAAALARALSAVG